MLTFSRHAVFLGHRSINKCSQLDLQLDEQKVGYFFPIFFYSFEFLFNQLEQSYSNSSSSSEKSCLIRVRKKDRVFSSSSSHLRLASSEVVGSTEVVKFCIGGTLLQPWPTLQKVLWKWCISVAEIKWRPNKKKGLRRKLKSFPPPKLGEDQEKKGLPQNLRPFSAGNLQDVLVLAGYFSSAH